MSGEKKTPRMLIRDLLTAIEAGEGLEQEVRDLQEQLKTCAPTDTAEAAGAHRKASGIDPDEYVELVPEQVMPAPLTFLDLSTEAQEYIGSRPQPEILDLLHDGVSLSLVVAQEEYCIEGKSGLLIFEVWHQGTTLIYVQAYDSLDALLIAEGARPSFSLSAFELIG